MKYVRRSIPSLVLAALSLTASAAPQDKTSMASVNSHGEQADTYSSDADVSGDGRFVVFQSRAKNLVAGFSGGSVQVFLRDRFLGTTTLASLNPAGLAHASGKKLEMTARAYDCMMQTMADYRTCEEHISADERVFEMFMKMLDGREMKMFTQRYTRA